MMGGEERLSIFLYTDEDITVTCFLAKGAIAEGAAGAVTTSLRDDRVGRLPLSSRPSRPPAGWLR